LERKEGESKKRVASRTTLVSYKTNLFRKTKGYLHNSATIRRPQQDVQMQPSKPRTRDSIHNYYSIYSKWIHNTTTYSTTSLVNWSCNTQNRAPSQTTQKSHHHFEPSGTQPVLSHACRIQQPSPWSQPATELYHVAHASQLPGSTYTCTDKYRPIANFVMTPLPLIWRFQPTQQNAYLSHSAHTQPIWHANKHLIFLPPRHMEKNKNAIV
jgi:hypothetical protein